MQVDVPCRSASSGYSSHLCALVAPSLCSSSGSKRVDGLGGFKRRASRSTKQFHSSGCILRGNYPGVKTHEGCRSAC
eukprot:1173182-Amphidinium_carterae.1